MKTRVCNCCNTEKPLDQFQKKKGYKEGRIPQCFDCSRAIELARHHANKHEGGYGAYNYEKDRDAKLRAAYGISYGEYQLMLEAQQGACAICGTTSTGKRKAFHVDHCHHTGKVRGLLCSNCNTGIGGLRDDIGLLKRAIEYLENNGN